MAIEVVLNGSAVALEDAATAVLGALGAGTPERREARADDGGTEKGKWMAVAVLILAIPPAIDASWNLAERARLAERVTGFLQHLRQTDGDAVLRADGLPPLDLRTATPDEVLEWLIRARDRRA